MDPTFNPSSINERVQAEIDHFLKDEPALKADVEYVYKIGVPDRPKAYLMLQFAKVLGVAQERVMPFVTVADLMMAAAMNNDDIIDDNDKRCGEPTLWKTKGINSTIMVTDYMYALIFSILKRYRPNPSSSDFKAYQQSENLLVDYFRVMNIAQYKTTMSADQLVDFTLDDLENLATEKASLLFQFCSAVPAYFANKLVKESEVFGYQLGIVRQYVSDVHDFLEIPPEEDYNKKGVSGDSARMEDYFTHQPNLVLVLTGISGKLDPEEKGWF
jgi:geranylgeranyl pyrophosphate synthase